MSKKKMELIPLSDYLMRFLHLTIYELGTGKLGRKNAMARRQIILEYRKRLEVEIKAAEVLGTEHFNDPDVMVENNLDL